ncbi:hypothetical protein MRX96_058855 [Rhipicephalus microplus]
MVGNTSLTGVATLAIVVLVVLYTTEIHACDDGACYSRCVGDGATSGSCQGGICLCRKDARRCVDTNRGTWSKHGKRSVDA